MVLSTREVIRGNQVELVVDIKDARGIQTDPDRAPLVSIINARDEVVVTPTGLGVVRIGIGRFRYYYTPPVTAVTGVWSDAWTASIDGFEATNYFTFIVLSAECAQEVTTDGYQHIGDDPEICWTEAEVIGINILLYCLKNRLKNNMQVESTDAYGNIEYIDCHVFTNDELIWFLKCSLSEFNQTPHFTDFSFGDPVIYERFGHIIVEGAYILALSAQVLIEAGKEFTLNDSSIGLNPPPLSQTMNTQITNFLSAHRESLKFIKGCIKPRPTGFGSFRSLSQNPNWLRLRHLRERRI